MKTGFKHRFIYLVLFASVGLLSSCGTSKNITELNTNTDNLYRYDNVNQVDTSSIASLSIDEFFSDDKLIKLLHQGLENNYDIKIAIERINQANANLVMAKAAKWPNINLALRDEFTKYSSNDGNSSVLGYNSNQLYLGFNASWEIDVWGKLNNAKKAQLAAWYNSHESLALVKTNLIANIANAYYNLVALDEQRRITIEMISSMEESSATIKALKDAGIQNAVAVEQSDAQLYNTNLSVFTIENEIRQQENALCILLGITPTAIERSSFEQISSPQKLDFGIPAQLLANRPDVKSAELAFREAFELTNVAQKDLYPSLQLSSAFFGYNGTDFSNLLSPKSIVANLVGGLTMPIFNQKRLKGNLAIAQSRQNVAALNFESSLLTAGQEVSDILFGFDNTLKINIWRQKQILSLSNAVGYNKDLLKAGEADYIEVLAAQQSLLNAKLNGVYDKLNQLSYGVDLYKALGGGTK